MRCSMATSGGEMNIELCLAIVIENVPLNTACFRVLTHHRLALIECVSFLRLQVMNRA
jgi:hypothetical protein